MAKAVTLKNNELPSPFRKVLPGLGINKDRLRLVLYFYAESIVLQNVDEESAASFRMVDARDLANALAGELSFGSGLLPENVLWWTNDNSGPVTALWVPPAVRRLAVQTKDVGPPDRYDMPLPGLIFLCRPGLPPWVYAASRRPAGPKDRVYRAPLPNVYEDGHSCAGSQKYPADVGGVPGSFFRSFFTREETKNRSKKHPHDVVELWKELDRGKKKEFPLSDLLYHGTVGDLIQMKLWGRYY